MPLKQSNLKSHEPSGNVIWNALWPCLFYFCCSFSMNIINKSILTNFQWKYIYTMAACQNFLSLIVIGIGVMFNLLKNPIQNVPSNFWKSILPLAFLNLANIITGFASLRLISMPMYLVLRRLSTFKIMIFEIIFLNRVIPKSMQMALGAIAIGSIVAGITDLSFNVIGYALAILQNIWTASNLVFAKKCSLSPVEIIFINSSIGFIFCAILSYTLEFQDAINFPYLYDQSFILLYLVMCGASALYQFSVYLCTTRNSALATSVTGNIKDLASTIIGFLAFPDASISLWNMLGVGISFFGAYTYSYLKFTSLKSLSPTPLDIKSKKSNEILKPSGSNLKNSTNSHSFTKGKKPLFVDVHTKSNSLYCNHHSPALHAFRGAKGIHDE